MGLSGLRLNAVINFEVFNQGNYNQEILKKYNWKICPKLRIIKSVIGWESQSVTGHKNKFQGHSVTSIVYFLAILDVSFQPMILELNQFNLSPNLQIIFSLLITQVSGKPNRGVGSLNLIICTGMGVEIVTAAQLTGRQGSFSKRVLLMAGPHKTQLLNSHIHPGLWPLTHSPSPQLQQSIKVSSIFTYSFIQ